jgi:formamidopyrimidine-DNA glycosylase
MPELPEVESIRKELESFIVGHTINKVKVNYGEKITGDIKKINGGKIERIRRFGKVLSIDLNNNYSIVIHIKLTGQLIYKGPNLKRRNNISKKVVGGVPGKHTHVVFILDKDAILYFNDYRKFGWIKIVKTNRVKDIDFIKNLGPEPLDGLNFKKLSKLAASYNGMIKTLLMDQTKVAGVGNIYANDALWLAGIHPEAIASDISKKKIKDLYEAIENVLKRSLKQGGASELAYVRPSGEEGDYQDHTLVYGRDGESCKRHKNTKIKKIKVAGRGTYFCPKCQKK